MKAKTRRRPQVVYLGASSNDKLGKVKRLAKLKPTISFTNINTEELNKRNKNYSAVQADFIDGLKKKANASIGIIRSEMSLGYYGTMAYYSPHYLSKGAQNHTEPYNRKITAYTARVLKLAKRKLKPNGKIIVIAENSGDYGAFAFDNIKKAAEITGFNFSYRRITKIEAENAEMWTNMAFERKKPLFVITLTK